MHLIPYKLIRKWRNFKLLLSVLFYRKMLLKECKNCASDVRVYYPISLKGLKYISIGTNFKLDYGGILEAWDNHNGKQYFPQIKIGSNVSFGKNCHIGCIENITIDDGVLFGSNVLVIDHNHGLKDYSDINIIPNKRFLSSSGPIHIGKNVWVGEKVTILSGVSIGDNTIIGANSVVTKNIPANCVACGIPAKVIKTIKEI